MASPLTQIKEIWNRLPMTGRIATIGAAVATLGLIGAMVYYGSQPEYGVLFSDLKPTDAQAIVEKLKAANVPYSLANGGTSIQVPHERISELRLQMAGDGAISGGHVGFDLFDKTNFGATDFAQQVNFRRAIEGELSRTLEGMDEVETARVHITPQKESVFTEKEEGAKASVLLKVKQGKELSAERTDAIVSLIASSVEGLDVSNVSVLDTRGRLLVAAGRGKSNGITDAGAFHAQLEAKQKYETENAARIIALLEPVVGQDRVRADVAADIDFSQVEQSEEKYNPQSQVVRSQQTLNEARNSANPNPNGIVGARSNNPTTQASPTPAPSPAAQTNGDSRNTSTVNYEIDKTVRKTVGGGGRVNRMTVSVVVDNKTVNGVEVARTPEEIKQIQDLVGGAIGIDTNRGDSVVVQAMPFDKPADTAVPPSSLDKYKQFIPNAIKFGALILVAVLLLWFVILPARKALKAAMVSETDEQKLLAAAAETDSETETEEEKRLKEAANPKQLEESTEEIPPLQTVAELEAQMAAEDEGLIPVNKTQERLEAIKNQITEQSLNDTETVVSTLRGWLRETN